MDASKDIQTVDYPLSNPHSDVRSRFFYNILLYYKRKIITSVLQSRETVWWFLLKCQIQGLFPLRDPQVNLQYFVFQPGKDWPGLWALAPHCFFFVCLFGLVNTSDNLLFFCPSAVVGFFSPPNGTNLLSPCCVSLMKALYWQRTLGGRAGLMDVALTVIWVVLGGVWAFLMRTQWQWVTVCWGTGVLK